MTLARFRQLVAEALDSLPDEFAQRVRNVAVLVEDYPPGQRPRRRTASTPPRPATSASRPTPAASRPVSSTPAPDEPHSELPVRPAASRKLVLGVFIGTPATRRSIFDLSAGPDRIILYRRNIEAVCRTDAEIRREIRQTVMHELGHYFGMSEEQLRDV